MVRAVLPLLTLTLLAEDESYGYELTERLSAHGLDVTTGLVYPLLSRLERDGLVSTRMVQSANGPPRKYFALTPAGMAALEAAQEQWQVVSTAVRDATEKEHPKND
ncbi:PadR family transcriptional regulator [Arthrobacter citreus]